MMEEMSVLYANGTWKLMSLPSGQTIVGCHWVYTVKVSPSRKVDHLKARLVAKGYAQIFGIDFGETFFLIAKIVSVRLLFSLATIHHWTMHQLDIKNIFCIEISRMSIWSNFLDLLLTESTLAKYVISKSHYMA